MKCFMRPLAPALRLEWKQLPPSRVSGEGACFWSFLSEGFVSVLICLGVEGAGFISGATCGLTPENAFPQRRFCSLILEDDRARAENRSFGL